MQPLNSGAPLPANGKERWWKVIAPKGQQLIRGVILGDTFHGVWTHFLPPTLPCAMTPECAHCRGGLGSRFCGYIPFVQAIDKTEYVLALTYGACLQLMPQLERRGTLRGLCVELKRRNSNPKSAVMVKVCDALEPASCRPAFDVLDSLSRMWGVNREYLARGCRRLDAGESYERYEAHRLAQLRPLSPALPPTLNGATHE